jgi:hypothetical protein
MTVTTVGEDGTMPAYRHCRHCYGDCPGDCLLPGDSGACIHGRVKMPFPQRVRLWFYRLWRS